MTTITKFFSLTAITIASTTLMGCSNNIEEPQTYNDSNILRIEAIFPCNTRATATDFEKEDQIGVFVAEENASLQAFGNIINNARFAYDGSKWNSLRTCYWNEGIYNIYAYYPYQGKVDDTDEFNFNVLTNQSDHNKYTQSDFMCARSEGVKSSSSPVQMTFNHVLSRVVVEVAKSDNYEGGLPDNMEAFIHNTVTTANINLSNGSVMKDAFASTYTIKMNKIANNKFEAIVVPQRIDTRRPLVEIISGNISYLMEASISFKQGFQHTITITLTANPQQAEIEIGGGINGWN